MNTFSISPEALDRVQYILNRSKSKYSDPVVVLVDMANPEEFMCDIKESFFEGKESVELAEAAKKRYEDIKEQLIYCLKVVTYEKTTFKPEDLFEVEGITFVMDISMRESLRNYCLIFEDESFLLKDSSGVVSNLQSALSK